MLKAHPLTAENIERLRAIYARFCVQAADRYRWNHTPVEFDVIAKTLGQGIFGCWVEDTALEEPVAFMLYCLEEHRAIEINVIYSETEDRKTVLDRLMRQFIPDALKLEKWDVISYAMLGDQEAFIRTITWYGFKPVGQAIVKFDFLDDIALQILKQQQLPALPPEYRLDVWKPEYAGATAENVLAAFQKSSDAKWDPRFRSIYGARSVVAMITGGLMGTHLPSCTSVILKNERPIGFCFVIQADATTGNIPLIGVHPDEKKKGLGNYLLRSAVAHSIQAMVEGHVTLLGINATMDTDNIPAIKMYRRMGFKEEYNYPHVYLPREKAAAFKPGQWC
jgi:ribosomal protein S18 acetylase RimI-like enzyme